VFAFSACDSGDTPQTPNDIPSGTTDNTTESETDAHVHAFGEWTTVKDATCTVKGEQERICSCGEKETKSIDATGHTEVIDAAVAATCTTDGKTEGSHCSRCNKTFVVQTIIDKFGHTEVIDTAIVPTCTTDGKTEGKHCSVCKAILIAQTIIDKFGHTEIIDSAVPATETSTGLTEGKHCSVCNSILIQQNIIPKIDTTPPIVTSVTLDKTSASVGETINITVAASDESEIEPIRFCFRMSNGKTGNAWTDLYKGADGLFHGSITIDETFVSGRCSFGWMQVDDHFSNSTLYSDGKGDYPNIYFDVVP
jgi:hypothetical protein